MILDHFSSEPLSLLLFNRHIIVNDCLKDVRSTINLWLENSSSLIELVQALLSSKRLQKRACVLMRCCAVAAAAAAAAA